MIDLIAIGILGIIIVVMLLGHLWYVKQVSSEREKFVNALIARNATELQNLEITSKVPAQTKSVVMPDLVPVQELDDGEFAKMIGSEELIG